MELPPFTPIVLPARVIPVEIRSLRHLIRMYNQQNPEEPISYKAAHVAVSSHCTAKIQLSTDDCPLFYAYRSVPKSSGGMRKLSSPSSSLKSLQRWILRNCFTDEMISTSAYAYRPKRSIQDCAAIHIGSRWLIKFDLTDFFGSISEARVYELFRALSYGELVSFELARLTTFVPDINTRRNIQGSYSERIKRNLDAWKYSNIGLSIESKSGPYPKYLSREGKPIRGVLPQGSPTAGIIANICAGELDRELELLAIQFKLRYSRYCDDLFFSTDCAQGEFDRHEAVRFICEVNRSVLRHGFRTNQKKTRVVPPGSKKLILGLQVDESVRLDTTFKRDLDYHIRGIEKFGLYNHTAHISGKPRIVSFLHHLEGKIAFAKGVEPRYGRSRELSLKTALQAGNDTDSNHTTRITE
ncbi:reverse transcriptase family protein [Arcanobacterium hippocoleae]